MDVDDAENVIEEGFFVPFALLAMPVLAIMVKISKMKIK